MLFKMMDDVLSFIYILASVLLGFAAAFLVLFEPYTPSADWPFNVPGHGSNDEQTCPVSRSTLSFLSSLFSPLYLFSRLSSFPLSPISVSLPPLCLH